MTKWYSIFICSRRRMSPGKWGKRHCDAHNCMKCTLLIIIYIWPFNLFIFMQCHVAKLFATQREAVSCVMRRAKNNALRGNFNVFSWVVSLILIIVSNHIPRVGFTPSGVQESIRTCGAIPLQLLGRGSSHVIPASWAPAFLETDNELIISWLNWVKLG